MSLEISFSYVSLRRGFWNFLLRGLGVSDFAFLANDQNHEKIVFFDYFLKRAITLFRVCRRNKSGF